MLWLASKRHKFIHKNDQTLHGFQDHHSPPMAHAEEEEEEY
jgi:hypothetical protein